MAQSDKKFKKKKVIHMTPAIYKVYRAWVAGIAY